MTTTYREELYPLCEELDRVAMQIIESADNLPIGGGFADAKCLALALLCRTRLNFKGALQLLKADFVVEARTLARSCFENLFLVGGIEAEGDAFIQLMKEDDQEGKRLKAHVAHDMDTFDQMLPESQKALKAFVAANTKPKGKLLAPKTASRKSDFGVAYIAYSQLSSDAAHGSLTALKRHIDGELQGETVFPCISVEPPPTGDELNETIHLLFTAYLSVQVGVNQILGGTAAGQLLPPLVERWKALEARSTGDVAASLGAAIQR